MAMGTEQSNCGEPLPNEHYYQTVSGPYSLDGKSHPSFDDDFVNPDSRPNWEPIAIVGMACRLPGGASSPSRLWDLLVKGGSGHCSVPKSRFNIEGFYHSDPNNPGTSSATGGYFLEDDIRLLENSFFGINNREVTSMDPQQRKLLEVVYECFESAGLSLEAVSGANIGCYVGNYTADFMTMQFKDPELFTRYTATGSGPTILANRLNHVFNLQGPSEVIDTACSSSLYCLHAACSALNLHECEAAIVAGVNLIQAPEHHIATCKAGILSKCSECRTFNESADGYGRGDGVGALCVKTLRDAIRDGDPIRSVIRATAVNSNGRTNGITLPSVLGQEAVIRKAYGKAGLDVGDTDYVECHGTGTAVGDPIEVEALARVFRESHSEQPLLLGSAKTNLGHSEAASGITSIIKTTLALEKGVIPATIGVKELNLKIKPEKWNVRVVTRLCDWPQKPTSQFPPVRRASVSSFGYGGANAHAILDAAANYGVGDDASPECTHGPKVLLPLSASNAKSLDERFGALSPLGSGSTSLSDLTYTLCSRRSHLQTRGYLLVDGKQWADGHKLEAFQMVTFNEHLQALPFAFIFTGQGAQWPEMGKGLYISYPTFRQEIQNLDNYLTQLPHPPSWTLRDLITEPEETSTIHLSSHSQPACTAVQIALVALLEDWGITPTTVIGHSSGEIAASYVAGHISAREAITIAYYRGVVVSRVDQEGAMLVASLSEEAAKALVLRFDMQKAVYIACVNAPESVTLSGDARAIDSLLSTLQSERNFARILMTNSKAYHSQHMKAAGRQYLDYLSKSLEKDTEHCRSEGKAPDIQMISTVTGKPIRCEDLRTAQYWCDNLESPVLFKAALEEAASASKGYHFIELGPHSALETPIKRTLANNIRLQYSPTLLRGRNAVDSMLNLAGKLFVCGQKIALSKVNQMAESKVANGSSYRPRVLTGLPPYPWQYGSPLWVEPQISEDFRNRKFRRHELLGVRMVDNCKSSASWRNLLSLKSVHWLQDHRIGQDAVLPAAAYLAVTIEALRQIADLPIERTAFLFRRIHILKALVVPDSDAVEICTELRPTALSNTTVSKNYWEFIVSSTTNGKVIVHARGLIGHEPVPNTSSCVLLIEDNAMEYHAMEKWYERFGKAGLAFGQCFQTLKSLKISKIRGERRATSKINLNQGDGMGETASTYCVHPIIIDAVLQTGLISDAAGSSQNLRCYVPVSIDRVRVTPSQTVAEIGTILAQAERTGLGSSHINAALYDERGAALCELHDARIVTYPGVHEFQSVEERHPLLRVLWKLDVTDLSCRDSKVFTKAISCFEEKEDDNESLRQQEWLSGALDLITHKHPTANILELDSRCPDTTKLLLDRLGADTSFKRFRQYTLASMDQCGRMMGRHIRNTADLDISDTRSIEIQGTDHFNVVLLSSNESTTVHLNEHSDSLHTMVEQGASLLCVADTASFRSLVARDYTVLASAPLDSGFMICLALHPDPPRADSGLRGTDILCICGNEADQFTSGLRDNIAAHINHSTRVMPFNQVSLTTVPQGAIIISTIELEGPMLSSSTEGEFDRMKILIEKASLILWITSSGLLKPRKPDLALYSGLSRAVMMEQPSLKLLSFDIDNYSYDQAAISESVRSVLERASQSPQPDLEYVYHEGYLYISRFVPDEAMNKDFRCRQEGKPIKVPLEEARSCRLAMDRVGQIDTLHFDQESTNEDPIAPDSVEIQVQCVGLNAKDIYALAGQVDTKNATCTLEYCGIITKTGHGVKHIAPGDRVVSVAPGHFKTYEHVPAWTCFKLRDSEDFPKICTLFVAFGAAIYAFYDRANLQPGESVLIHSASGGTGLAAIQIAKLIGAEIFATAGTQERRRFLVETLDLKPENIFSSRDSSFLPGILAATGGHGVDVVLNSLTGDLLHDSWQACAPLGRFVEIGKRDIVEHGNLEMGVFKRSATFTAFDLSDLFHSQVPAHRTRFERLAARVLELYRAGRITAVQPLRVFDISEIVPAIRYFSSNTRMGKVAISLEDAQSQITYRAAKYRTILSSSKSYIMVGCLGGLGRSLSKWMFERGAREFVFIGRSGADKPSARQLVEELQSAGAIVKVVTGDVSCYKDVENLVKHTSGPIGGLVQAAMGLKEALFTTMSNEQWHSGIDAKVAGTWNLHNAIAGLDGSLDFFVMTSSVAGSIGTATESNYCAANHFLDTFARYRRHLGLPAYSLGLGMISEVGYLHEHPEIEALLLRKGIRPYNEEEVLRIFDMILSSSVHSTWVGNDHFADAHRLTGLEATGLQAQREQGFDGHRQVIDDPRASILLQSFNEASPLHQETSGRRGTAEELAGEILEASRSDRDISAVVHDAIAQKMSNLLLLPVEKLNAEMPLSGFGMDSMLAAELRAHLYQVCGVDVSFQTLMGETISVRALTKIIADVVSRKM